MQSGGFQSLSPFRLAVMMACWQHAAAPRKGPMGDMIMKWKCIAAGFAVVGVAGVTAYLVYPLFGLTHVRPECVFSGGIIIGMLLAAVLSCGCRHRCRTPAGSGKVVNMFVGNLPFKSSQEDLRRLFASYGEVKAVRIVRDRQTGRPRGFGFVEMREEDAAKAIRALNESEFGGRTIKVNIAEDKPRA